MDTIADSPSDSSFDTPPIPRKRQRKPEPTEADFVHEYEQARTRLRAFRTQERNKAIQWLGTLAYKAGLHQYDAALVQQEFVTLAKRLAGTVLCAGVILFSSGCSTRKDVVFAASKCYSTPSSSWAWCQGKMRPENDHDRVHFAIQRALDHGADINVLTLPAPQP